MAAEHVQDPEGLRAILAMCRKSHRRLTATAASIDDETVRRPSRLPGWTVGHVLTHVARNADGHARKLEGALRGEEVPRYPGGMDQRDRDIDEGARRGAKELAEDVASSARRLEDVGSRCAEAGWPNGHLLAGDRWPVLESPLRRLREVEVHHADLGLGYEPSDWPADYARLDLPLVLGTVPGRIESDDDVRRLLAWLMGRADQPGDVRLEPF